MSKLVATLLAYDSFYFQNRQLFVIFGDVECEGDRAIEPGMEILIHCHSQLSISNKIHSIEYVRRPEKEYTGICILCEDDEERDILMALKVGNETCEIRDI